MVLDALILQTKLFLHDDMQMEVQDVQLCDGSVSKLQLKDYTSMIGTGGKLSLMVVMSFENTVLDQIVTVFMEGESVEDAEIEEIRDSVCGESVNNIIGLALPTFPNRGKGVTITPPVSITEPGHISKHKTSTITTANITTNYGQLSVSIIDSNI
ncbi:MAG: chemotaxis protein CheX [Campylobacterota bacterium]